VKVIVNSTIRHSAYEFDLPSTITMSLSCTVSDMSRDIARKSPILTFPPLLGGELAPQLIAGDPPLESRQDPWRQKTIESLDHKRTKKLLQGRNAVTIEG